MPTETTANNRLEMAETVISLVATTIQLIEGCVTKYTDFCAFKEECVAFQASLISVAEVLENVEQELSKTSTSSVSPGSGGTNTTLRRPLELLQEAIKEGRKVLAVCSSKRTLQAIVFSRQYMGMLNRAKDGIKEAMERIQGSSVAIQVSTRRMMDSLTEKLEELDTKIIAINASQNDVVNLLLRAVQSHNDNDRDGANTSIIDALVKSGVVTSAKDGAEQLADLRIEAESMEKAKAKYDEAILKAVLALTAPRNDAGTGPVSPRETGGAQQKRGSEASSAVLDCMLCPISGEIMRDPVTVFESGITYDRGFLCKSLLTQPDLDPATNQRFDFPLRYVPNFTVRKMIMAQHGDSFYRRFDDAEFKVQYEAKWKELLQLLQPVVDSEHPSVGGADGDSGGAVGGGSSSVGSCSGWPGVDAGSSLADPTSITCGGSGSDRDHNDIPRGGFNASKGSLSAGSGGSEEMSLSPDVAVTQVTPETREVAKLATAAALNEKFRECWSSRRGRMLIVGMAFVVAALFIVGVVLAVVKPWPGGRGEGGPNVPPPSPSPTAIDAPTPSPTNIGTFNDTLPHYTNASLQNPNSPQYRAYKWVTQSDQVPQRDEPNDERRRLFRMTQRFALSTLFYSIQGLETWVNSTGTECQWGTVGVTLCDTDSHLVAIDAVGGNGGTLPREVGLLLDLTSLDLQSNSLTSIPTQLGLLSALESLDLSSNDIWSTPIPTELGMLSALTSLDLSYNEFTSSIFTELGQLVWLTSLGLRANSLTSTIPSELGNLTALTILDIGRNPLTSSIPTELGLLSSNLATLELRECALNSSIPTELGMLTALTDLNLYSNELTSTIPTELGNLSALTHLGLQDNRLNGTFPSALCYVGASDTGTPAVDCLEVSCTCCGCPT